MGFLKTAKAIVQHPGIHAPQWAQWRQQLQRQGQSRVASSINLAEQASEILGERFDPSKYLLTHVTIVSSVDTESVANVKLGSVDEDGRKIMRKFADFHITPSTEQFINNNNDAFSRGVLLKSYRTFVGGHNWLEHVQLVEQSKGRILDSVARDIGPSVYVDLLVATHRKHAELTRKIESGQLGTLSMGCSCSHTTCTKCGNVAHDEVQLCDCIRYSKGNKFFDRSGQQRRIAELCGHESEDPTGGVNFIEASWVEVPAFTGAVMRNIIEPGKLSPGSLKQMKAVLDSPPKDWIADQTQKAAKLSRGYPVRSVHKVSGELTTHALIDELQARIAHLQRLAADDFDFGGDEAPAEDAAPAEEAPTDEGDLGDLVKETENEVLKRVKKQIKEKITPKPVLPSLEEGSPSTSNNVIKDGSKAQTHITFGPKSKDLYEVFRDGIHVGTLVQRGGLWRSDIQGYRSIEAARLSILQLNVRDQLSKSSKQAGQYLAGLGTIVAISKSSHELLDNVFRYHEACGRPISKRLYRAASQAVASSQQTFSKACVRALGRKPSEGDLKTIIRLGRLLALRNRTSGTSHAS